jgi:hypothetical protein
VDLDRAEQPVHREPGSQDVDDVGDRGCRASQIEAAGRVERTTPGGRDERHHELVSGHPDGVEPSGVVRGHDVERQRQRREVPLRELEDTSVDLESQAARAR